MSLYGIPALTKRSKDSVQLYVQFQVCPKKLHCDTPSNVSKLAKNGHENQT